MKTLLITLFTCCLANHLHGTNLVQTLVDSSKFASDSTKKKTPNSTITGDVTISTGYYRQNGSEFQRKEVMPLVLMSNVMLTNRSGWIVPMNVSWSSQYNPYQPSYNQIGLSPRYQQWLTLHAGHRNLIFSPFTLAGHTVLGAGVELNPGLLRLGAMYGTFNKAVAATNPDQAAVFGRTGYCVKAGFGNQQNYVDVILLNVTDNPQSIGSDQSERVKPAENMVISISSRVRLKQAFYFEFDAAGSAYTTDNQSEAVSTERNTDWRIRSLGFFKNLVTVRQSTQVRTALQTSLRYKFGKADLKLQYKRIEPDYKTMGAYYVQSDIESFLTSSSVRLLRQRLTLRGSLGLQRNNLLNQKKSGTNRLATSISAAYTTDNNLTLDVAYSNYGFMQKAGYQRLNDTLRISQVNRTISGSVFKMWVSETAVRTLTGSASMQSLVDLNPFTASLNQNQTWNYDVNYSWQHLASGLDVTLGYTHMLTKAIDLTSAYYGPSISLSKKLLKDNRLNLTFLMNYVKSQETMVDISQSGFILNSSVGITYQPASSHRLSLNWSNTMNRGTVTFGQQQGSFQYALTF